MPNTNLRTRHTTLGWQDCGQTSMRIQPWPFDSTRCDFCLALLTQFKGTNGTTINVRGDHVFKGVDNVEGHSLNDQLVLSWWLFRCMCMVIQFLSIYQNLCKPNKEFHSFIKRGLNNGTEQWHLLRQLHRGQTTCCGCSCWYKQFGQLCIWGRSGTTLGRNCWWVCPTCQEVPWYLWQWYRNCHVWHSSKNRLVSVPCKTRIKLIILFGLHWPTIYSLILVMCCYFFKIALWFNYNFICFPIIKHKWSSCIDDV